MKKISLIPLLVLGLHAFAQQDDASRFASMITTEGLNKHLSVIAGEEMQGRETGTEGQRKAAAYIESRFKLAGLRKPKARVGMEDFVPREQVPAEVEAFDGEWRAIDSAVAPLMNSTDTLMLAAREENRNLFKSFNSRYTLERERLLKEATLRNVKEKPGYTFLHSAYTAVRMWITGIQLDKFHGASTAGKVAQLYPFVLTLAIFLMAVVMLPWALVREKGLWKNGSRPCCCASTSGSSTSQRTSNRATPFPCA